MNLRALLLVLAVAVSPARAEEPVRSLAVAAKLVAAGMPAGGLVTAEQIGDRVEFGSAGKLDAKGGPPEKLIFEIGSLTKVFTSLLLAQAVVEKKVTLRTTVGELLGPEQTYADRRVGRINLWQLATHTSGLPRLPPNLNEGADPADPYAHYDRAHLLAGLSNTLLNRENEVSYSNYGAGLLGSLLAQVYGRSWEELVREKITDPLGMRDTAVALDPGQQARLADPWTGAKPSHAWRLNALVGAGGLHSTASDLLKLGHAMLAPEKSPFPEALALQLQPQTITCEIGLAIFRRGVGADLTYNHAGATGGYGSVLEVTPARRLIRIVLSNNSDWPPAKAIAATAAEKPAPREGAPLSTEALREYAGVYGVDSMQRFTVLLRGSELWARLTGQPFFHLFPEADHPDRFFYQVVPAELAFHREAERVAGLTLFQNGQTVAATRDRVPVPVLLFPTAAELKAYTGTYTLAPGVTFILTVDSDTLYAQLTGQGAAPVFCTRRDYFEYDIVTAALEFERDAAGAVTALILHQNGLSQHASKTK